MLSQAFSLASAIVSEGVREHSGGLFPPTQAKGSVCWRAGSRKSSTPPCCEAQRSMSHETNAPPPVNVEGLGDIRWCGTPGQASRTRFRLAPVFATIAVTQVKHRHPTQEDVDHLRTRSFLPVASRSWLPLTAHATSAYPPV